MSHLQATRTFKLVLSWMHAKFMPGNGPKKDVELSTILDWIKSVGDTENPMTLIFYKHLILVHFV